MPTSDDSNKPGGRADAYDLEAALPAPPRLPGEVAVHWTPEDVIDDLAAALVAEAMHCVRTLGDFHLALSGGSTPQPLYERLMYDPNCRGLPWRRTHLWMVDERCVNDDHELSNFRMIRETIVEHADIPPDQVHPMRAMSPRADETYEGELRETLCWREKGQDRLDFVLLGMGSDGHTASLFPRTAALEERQRLVIRSEAPGTPAPQRITMTYPLINASRVVAALVMGAGKAAMIDRIAGGRDTPRDLPILGIRPSGGTLRWYLDAEAARRPT
jgi:6-phosphogluconolactonase